MGNAPPVTDQEIARVLSRAASQLAGRVPDIAVLVPEPVAAVQAEASRTETGWLEIGRLTDAADRFWYRVLWNPEHGTGRLLREWPKARRGVLGEAVSDPPTPD